MPTITQDDLEKLLRTQFPDLASKYVRQFALLFLDLQKKCDSAEISTRRWTCAACWMPCG